MRRMRSLLVSGTMVGLGLCIEAGAQTDGAAPVFAKPVRLSAGDKLLGENRYFPSPVFHDVDRDGRLDIVVGDLFGRITVALRAPGDRIAFGAETKLEDGEGKQIDFHNW